MCVSAILKMLWYISHCLIFVRIYLRSWISITIWFEYLWHCLSNMSLTYKFMIWSLSMKRFISFCLDRDNIMTVLLLFRKINLLWILQPPLPSILTNLGYCQFGKGYHIVQIHLSWMLHIFRVCKPQ